MKFGTDNYQSDFVDMVKAVEADRSDWQSTLFARYAAFRKAQIDQRQQKLDEFMAREVPPEVEAKRPAYRETEQAAIDALRAAPVQIVDPVHTEAMLRLYVIRGGKV